MRIPLAYNLRNVRQRKVASAMTALGIAFVTAVFVATLALVEGFARPLASTGDPRHIIVLSQSLTTESMSRVTREQADILRWLPGVERDATGQPLVTADAVFLVNVPRAGTGAANVTVRGVSPAAFALRPGVRTTVGRAFAPGAEEVIVARGLAERFELRVGGAFRIKGHPWKIVGLFEAGEATFGSEVWCDADRLLLDIRRETFSSVTLRVAGDAAAGVLRRAIEEDPRLPLDALSEPAYYERQKEEAGAPLYLGFGLAGLLGVGAALGAMNTMHAAVAGRAREIAVMRAIGFGRGAVLLAFLVEAVLVATPGAVAGSAASLALDGFATGTTNFLTFGEQTFQLRVTATDLAAGVIFGVASGLLGGIVPAAAAARLPIVSTLRDA